MAVEPAASLTGDLALFAERAAALGVAVHRVAGSREAADAIESATRGSPVDKILLTIELAEAAPELIVTLDAAGRSWAHPGDPNETNDQPFGVSLAQLAIAETGSVFLAEPTLEDRGIGLLVATQLVICPSDALRPSLDDAASVLREFALRPGGAYTTLVTGPSRTADIERALTVGVQGPAKVIVVFVDDLT